jgi:hypothetical protein
MSTHGARFASSKSGARRRPAHTPDARNEHIGARLMHVDTEMRDKSSRSVHASHTFHTSHSIHVIQVFSSSAVLLVFVNPPTEVGLQERSLEFFFCDARPVLRTLFRFAEHQEQRTDVRRLTERYWMYAHQTHRLSLNEW